MAYRARLLRLELRLQVLRGVEVAALVPLAPPLDVVHADRHRPLPPFHLHVLRGVGEAALPLAALAVATLELTAHLRNIGRGGQQWQEAASARARYV